jgi:hypothetical protein
LHTMRQGRKDKVVISNVKPKMPTMTHSYSNPSYSRPSHVPTKVEDSAMDELVKGMREMKLKLEEKGQVSSEPTSKPRLGQT